VAITRKGITLSPQEEAFYLTAANAYETLLDTASACAHLRYVIHVVGAGHEARHQLAGLLRDRARCWLLEGHHVAATDCLQEATRLKPVDWKLWFLLAVAYIKGGSQEALRDAIPALDHALALKPTSHEAYILRGKCNWGLGHTDAGNRDFEQAGMSAPNHPEVVLFDQMMFRKVSCRLEFFTEL
jgi:Flp pilus assembly protein TadD